MNILIADDHQLVRDGLKLTLSKLIESANFFESASADETLKIARSQSGLDLALVDLYMPGVESFDLLTTLCDELPSTPIAIISGYEKQELVNKAIDQGAAGFIPKSAAPAVLLDAISQILDGGTYIPTTNSDNHFPEPEESSASPEPTLTPRQLAVLELVVNGKANKEIAHLLSISEQTVKTHVAAIFKIYCVSNRTQLALAAAKRFRYSQLDKS